MRWNLNGGQFHTWNRPRPCIPGHTALIPRRFLHDHVRYLRGYLHLVSYTLLCTDDEQPR